MKAINLILMFILGVIIYSCAPVFSSLQSAKMVGKNNLDVSPHYTSTSSAFDNETDHVQDHFGLQLGYGLSNKVDFITRYEYIEVTENGGNTNIVGFGPKISLITDKMAAYIPVGFAFGGDVDGVDELEVQPTLLFTLQAGKNVEINPSVKGIVGDGFFYVAPNLGLGLSTNFDKYAIRPEYGMLFNPGEKGHYGQFSIGLSFYFKELVTKKK